MLDLMVKLADADKRMTLMEFMSTHVLLLNRRGIKPTNETLLNEMKAQLDLGDPKTRTAYLYIKHAPSVPHVQVYDRERKWAGPFGDWLVRSSATSFAELLEDARESLDADEPETVQALRWIEWRWLESMVS